MIALIVITATLVAFGIGLFAGASIEAASRDRIEAHKNRWFRTGLSNFDVDWLLRELATWAEKYREANPTGRNLRLREKNLFWAVDTVGLEKLRPSK